MLTFALSVDMALAGITFINVIWHQALQRMACRNQQREELLQSNIWLCLRRKTSIFKNTYQISGNKSVRCQPYPFVV